MTPSKKMRKKTWGGRKKHSVHVTTFITSFIYMYVHGDLSSTRLNKSEMYLNCKLDCEDTGAGKTLNADLQHKCDQFIFR